MRAIFRFKRMYPKPKYHKGYEVQNGRFWYSDCNSIKGENTNNLVLLARETPVHLPLIYLCGNCFRAVRQKAEVIVDASRISK